MTKTIPISDSETYAYVLIFIVLFVLASNKRPQFAQIGAALIRGRRLCEGGRRLIEDLRYIGYT